MSVYKKMISAILTTVLFISVFCVSPLHAAVPAHAEQFDYFEYSPIPGYTIFTDEELAMMQNECVSAGVNETVGGMDAVTWTLTQKDTRGGCSIFTAYCRNILYLAANNYTDTEYGACDTINGKTIVTGTSFENKDGVCFRVLLNGEPYSGSVQITVGQLPCAGVSNRSDELDNDGDSTIDELFDAGAGFSYMSRGVTADSDGVVHFDFDTDFFQHDWWSKDNNGVAHTEVFFGEAPVYLPIPKQTVSRISRINVFLNYRDAAPGDRISIGDMKAFFDTRISTDNLRAQTDAFDALEERAYTAESYSAAAELRGQANAIFDSPESFTQTQIDSLADALAASIASLEPMFLIRDKSVLIFGFGWDDDQLNEIAEGGLCTDNSAVEADILPPDADTSILAIANPQVGDTDGWNRFTNAVDNGGSVSAIGNPFSVYEGDLTGSDGIRFWMRFDLESGNALPSAIRVGLGSARDGTYYECGSCSVPDGEGYIAVPWSAFKSADGKTDVRESVGSLDYISIMMKGYSGTYYISDLHAAVWSIAPTDFDPLRQSVSDAKAYMDTLDGSEYTPRSWMRALDAISAGEVLLDTYGVTDAERDSAIERINDALRRLIKNHHYPIPGDVDGDGEITVSDALAVLRVAAKLDVDEVTYNMVFAVGNVDRDNSITVSDALKILRVAAKLAGEDSLG